MFYRSLWKSIISLICFLSFTFTLFSQTKKAGEDSTNYITFHRVDNAWNLSKGKGVTVAVLDWLFDLSPEASKKYIEPVSLVPGQDIGINKPWHGEWMAEIIHKIAPEAKIIPIRTRPNRKKDDDQKEEPNYQKYLVKGIKYAADHGASFITNSMGPVKQTAELDEAVKYAAGKGAVFIDVHPEYVRKENDQITFCNSSQLNDMIIHCGIVSVPDYPVEPDTLRDFFTWPYDIAPVFKDGWGYSNGPPITAGIAALVKSVNPELKGSNIKKILIETSEIRNGFKILNAEKAVKETEKRFNK